MHEILLFSGIMIVKLSVTNYYPIRRVDAGIARGIREASGDWIRAREPLYGSVTVRGTSVKLSGQIHPYSKHLNFLGDE